MNKALKHIVGAGCALLVGTAVMAKLPAVSDEVKAKAAETAAKTGWNGKVDAYLLCKSQDKVAAYYYTVAKANNKDVKPATAMAPCADPGAFSYTPPEVAKPLEASGAHSPPATATSPPSSNTPAAVLAPGNKP